jgi:pimeloyl-ACP methyl ester carboxylesterase
MTYFPPSVHHTLSGANAPGPPPDEPVRLAVHELGPVTDRPAVVFCHGFPDLAYGWRHQLPAVADAGFRAVAPDQRGYGGSSAPAGVADYGLGHLCGDLADLLDALEVERAVFVGHDWGGFVAWAMPVLFPERCAGAVGVCTPYTPFPGTDFLRSMFPDPEKMYMLWFQEPEVPESVMDPQARLLFSKLMKGGIDPAVLLEQQMARAEGMDLNPFRNLADLPDLGELVVSDEELDHYAEVFGRTGFRGGINWYRNMDANAATYPGAGVEQLSLPTLMIAAEWDPVLPPALAEGMGERCSDLEMEVVAKAGHWVQQEDPEEVNVLLVDWLTRRFG